MITVEGLDITIGCRPGQSLLEALTAADVALESPCGGRGTCGKCLVKITGGPLPVASDDEIKGVGAAWLAEGYRLACRLYPSGDLRILPPRAWKKHRILSSGQAPDFKFNPSVKKVFYRTPQRAPFDNLPADQALNRLIGRQGRVDLAFLKALAPLKIGYASGAKGVTVVFDRDRPLTVEAGDSSGQAYGLALDIGSTTMVLSLVDLLNGRELGSASMINPQTAQGLDVLSRIAYAQEHGPEAVRTLQSAVVGGLEKMALELCGEHGVDPARVYHLAAAANSTMLHLWLGLAPDSLGQLPFAPTLAHGLSFRGAEIGLKRFSALKVSTLPSVSAYIGADIVAGAAVCGLKDSRENVLFIDIGTNGELVLSAAGRLMSCSCAAGPAFEGMNIHQGMRAADGAIEDVKLDWKRDSGRLCVSLKTIGGARAIGLCGSGILAAVRELLKIEMLRPDGRLLQSADLPPGDPRRDICLEWNGKAAVRLSQAPDEVIITQKDIRQVQLAKGAILSAIRVLPARCGLEAADLNRVIVAGQFGACVPTESLAGCGLIPPELADKVEYVGNSSKTGAYMALMSRDILEEMEALAGEIDYFELGAVENYDRLFAAAMKFPAWEANGLRVKG